MPAVHLKDLSRIATSIPFSKRIWPNQQPIRESIGLLPMGPMLSDKHFVYVLRNADPLPRFYVGLTSDVRARLEDHNAGRCPHTARHRPWQLHVVIEFPDEQRAIRFERYLKSGSGREFAKRHFDS